MSIARRILQGVLYALVCALLMGRSVSAVISHDENQFIAAGQMLAYHGALPYRDYLYTHMPYAVPLYALTAALSPDDYLAARLLGVLVWLACIPVMIAIVRLLRRAWSPVSFPTSPWIWLFAEFCMVTLFLYVPVSAFVLGAALNHSFATLLSLLALLFYVRAILGFGSVARLAFWSGIAVMLAALTRFNYASLAAVLFVLWVVHAWSAPPVRLRSALGPFLAGCLLASLPAIALLLLAPRGFYFANFTYIRLNTLYYDTILFRRRMDIPSKLTTFLGSLGRSPVTLALYLLALAAGLVSVLRWLRSRSPADLALVSTAAFAGVLYLTAFAPTPLLLNYFFAALPYMLVLIFAAAALLQARFRYAPVALSAALLLLLVSVPLSRGPLVELAALRDPSRWDPLEAHAFSQQLRERLPSGGRVLTLLPEIPLEAGLDIYPFTTTGAFTWRTSLLLSPERRLYYGMVSPDTLDAALNASPPAAILTGFETPNAGFTFGDVGGLERPLDDYALRHAYTRVSVQPAFLRHPLTLWLRP